MLVSSEPCGVESRATVTRSHGKALFLINRVELKGRYSGGEEVVGAGVSN